MKFSKLMLTAATFVAPSAALAVPPPPPAPAVTFTNGGSPLPAGQVVIADFNGGTSSYGGAVGSGNGFIVQSGSNGQGADPATGGTGDPYLSVLGGGSAFFSFANPLDLISFDYGSADTYNSFLLNLVGGGTALYTGQDILNAGSTANGNQGSSLTNGRVTFSAFPGASITGLTLSSTQNSLEIDNLSVRQAVPEPATWAMMLVGFGAVGYGMRRRNKAAVAYA